MDIRIGNVIFKNPVMVASGTFGYGEEMTDFYDISKLGAVITKTITVEPRQGNPPPRLFETPSGMLNSIGLANVGLERFINEKLPFLAMINTRKIVNVAGFSPNEFATLIKELDVYNEIDGFEVNISCPNVKKGGVSFANDPDAVFEITSMCRAKTKKLLIVKLSPNVGDIASMAKIVENAGGDAVSMINTLVGMSIDTKKCKPVFYNEVAGLSGPAIRPVALASVYKSYKKVKIPIIGIGGIDSFNTALEFFMAGASMIQIGTQNFIDPYKPVEIIDNLDVYLQKQKISLKELIGKAH